ncbi:MAG: hypothetical protein AB7P94_17395 [Steroidobacteraceae bacterium]
MTLSATALFSLHGNAFASGWQTELDSSSSTALEVPMAIRYEQNPVFGVRGFQYLRVWNSSVTAGDILGRKAPVPIADITSGTTTSITKAGAFVADYYVGGILWCADNADSAGAAPENQFARIIRSTTDTLTIDQTDAFSPAAATNDDFFVFMMSGADDTVTTNYAYDIAGVAMADHDQYDWGWFQFYGIHPAVKAIAAGTAITPGEAVIATDGNLVTGSAGADVDQRLGITLGLSSDTVKRTAYVNLFCGAAYPMAKTTAP